MHLSNNWLKSLSLRFILYLFCGHAVYGMAVQNSHLVSIPLIFDSDSGKLMTSACLALNERLYAETSDWETFFRKGDVAERALQAVISAMRDRDSKRLLALSDNAHGRDPKQFGRQAAAYFDQFQTVESLSISRAYEFDDTILFVLKMWVQKELSFGVLTFHRENSAQFGFLPYLTDAISFRVVNEWLNSPWGPMHAEEPNYCTTGQLAKLNYRAWLASEKEEGYEPWQRSMLYLNGAPISKLYPRSETIGQIVTAVDSLESALASGNSTRIAENLTPKGAQRFLSVEPAQTIPSAQSYESSLANSHPIFAFNLDAVAVVYLRTSEGDLRVLYLEAHGDKFLLTNSSRVVMPDGIFKASLLLKAATQKPLPFGSLRIK